MQEVGAEQGLQSGEEEEKNHIVPMFSEFERSLKWSTYCFSGPDEIVQPIIVLFSISGH